MTSITFAASAEASALDWIPASLWAGIRDRSGTTDLSAYLQAAIDAQAAHGGGTVLLPAGRYWLSASSTAVLLKSGVRLRGAGMGVTEIYFDDSSGGNHGISQAAAAVDNIALEDLTIRASGAVSRTENGLHPIHFDGSGNSLGNIRILRVEVADSRAISLYCVKAQRVEVDGCRINRSARDGIAVWRTPYVSITNNMIAGSGDDAISVHSIDSDAAPVRGNIIITGNHLTQCQGIVCLGAKRATIANNVLFLCYARGIRVGRSNFTGSPGYTTQGTTATVAISITNNVICDLIQRPETGAPNTGNWYLRIGGGPWGLGSDTAAPGRPRPSAGGLVDLFGSGAGNFYLNDTDLTGTGTVASPGGQGLTIRGNILLRTLPATADCTTWGYGPLFVGASAAATGGTWSGAVGEAQLNSDGLWFMPACTDALIEGNLIRTTGAYAIHFNLSEHDDLTPTAIPALTFERVVIRGNTLADFTTAGIRWNSSNVSHQRISVLDNVIDGDPRFVAPTRGANGSWTANTSGPAGILLTGAAGWEIDRNLFRNLRLGLGQSAGGPVNLGRNFVVGLPKVNSNSYSASNIGLGAFPRGSDGWVLVAEDGDPTSASFGQVQNVATGSSSAMPSAGYWLAGTLVPVDAPTASGSLGWLRLTTGSGNTAGTDWIELRAQNGDPVRAFAVTATPAWVAGKTYWRALAGSDGITVTALPNPGTAATLTITMAYIPTAGLTLQNGTSLKLAGGVNAVLTKKYDAITLVYDTTDNVWVETARVTK